ncbi:mRNA transport regulator MTR10 [Nannizzia gypsea CBS 118893]|uniref:mRNA transport regulator MTR10 n=1 Tax=Arthroderma gypseum (strain ATCC MYA-4604 / CBS 118893) TaxID=535722 RepID=E4V3J7_ARTGP|nr:mRNA transport regulator MTR10 [Nannizzia gypsea CBS 118893]EFR04571.1 mRNA transport regulator MTR10 [Nannizzia gypsea CBS 118893]
MATASSASAPQQAFAPVLAALSTMQGSASRQEKTHAHEFLEKFQKSIEAWTATHAILQAADAQVEAKLFAATTLKGKITYDLDQLPESAQPELRTSILSLLSTYRSGPRPIRTQLCVSLATLAIQMTSWKDVLPTVGAALGDEAGDCVLEFLKILPEEVIEGRKINLTEEELSLRTKELLEENASQVLGLLTQYSQSSSSAATNPLLLECITSWMREIPAAQIVESPLMDVIMKALAEERSFEAAVDCICMIYRDTLEVDDSMDIIKALYPRIIALRPRIREAAEAEDVDLLRGLTRLFAEAAEAWVLLIARLPADFRNLVEAVLECCSVDKDRDAISITFVFWYELKQYLTLERYARARATLGDLFSKLVDVMIKHLEYPSSDGDESDLFDGDREQEEKFRSFRHSMGDVLKDCCAVIGVSECLGKAYSLIQAWVAKYGPQARHDHVPHWQELEAPLFSMRAMGRMVEAEESYVLPEIIPLIVRIPDQEKVRFQAIMALGRYTEWTAQHPETLEAQLNYVISGFQHESQEVVQAAALAFKFLGTDCQKLLGSHIPQLHTFYESVIDGLKPSSQEEVTEGVAAVLAVQPVEKIYEGLKLFCNPLMTRIMTLANNAKDEEGQKAVADHLQLIAIFIQVVCPYVEQGKENPGVKYCGEILPVLSTIVMNFTKSTPILERVCRCWRYMIISYRNAMAPLLPTLAQNISSGFEASREGCFLWATDAIVREFSTGAELVDSPTSVAVYQFFEQQVVLFLRILNDLPPEQLPDMIEDFFRLATDAVRFFPKNTVTSNLSVPIFSAALSALTLQQIEPLTATLQYLRDLVSFGFEKPAVSNFTTPEGEVYTNSPEIRAGVKQIMVSQGSFLVQRVLTGMMFTFPGDCFPDASAVLMSCFELLPAETASWIEATIQMLPARSVKPGESERLMKTLSEYAQLGDMRKIRVVLQDFTNSYRRRNVAPREGLGRLEATRFRFTG